MVSTSKTPVQISIDLKKSRIRVHKESLHSIGTPKYIHFLVNRSERLIAIRAVPDSEVDLDAHRVDQICMASDFCVDIYSMSFINLLHREFDCLEEGYTYRLTGTAYKNHKTAVFRLDSLKKVEN